MRLKFQVALSPRTTNGPPCARNRISCPPDTRTLKGSCSANPLQPVPLVRCRHLAREMSCHAIACNPNAHIAPESTPNMAAQGDSRGPGKVLILFDVDGTLTPARKGISIEMHSYLQSLRERVHVGLVGGSDLNKIAEQTLPPKLKSGAVDPIENCINSFDYVFAENGLVAYKDGKLLAKQSLLSHLGEDKVQRFINFCLRYMSNLTLPAKRGNFIEFRNGLINVCPVGRSCSQEEREQFNAFDNEHKIRRKFINELEEQFGPNSPKPLELVFTIGGQISFDVFPRGWDKTFCLGLIDSKYDEIYFFGDKTHAGGNDHEIFMDERTIGRSVTSPEDTLSQLKDLGL